MIFLLGQSSFSMFCPVLGPLRSSTHSVQGTLSWVEFPVYSTQLNWTYAATYIQFSWVEGSASTQLPSGCLKFPALSLVMFTKLLFKVCIQSINSLIHQVSVVLKRHLASSTTPSSFQYNNAFVPKQLELCTTIGKHIYWTKKKPHT